MRPQEPAMPEQSLITVRELLRISGLSLAEIQALIDFGVIEPVGQEEDNLVFTSQCVKIVRTAGRLRADFDLRPDGVALVATYLERIEQLEIQVKQLRCRLPDDGD